MAEIKLIQKPGEEETPPEIIAQSIEQISAAMKKLTSTRLTREAIITLVHVKSKVPKRDIEIVMAHLETLEQTWLKRKT